jgi:uncharacterized membrane protein YkgB
MKRMLKTIVILLALLVLIGDVYGGPQDTSLKKFLNPENTNVVTDNPEQKVNQQIGVITGDDLFKAIDAYNKSKVLHSGEFLLCILLLSFAFLLCSAEIFLFVRGVLTSSQVGKLLIITLIIFSVLFLITAGYDNNQIAPAVGLLGTIAGYLLGKSANDSETTT